jgi:hypothetical protein
MTSKVELANRALAKLGEDAITSFQDGSNASRAVASAYDSVRDAVLRAHPWSFALMRAAIPALSSAPIFEYGKAFQLPTDFLRLVEISGIDGRYRTWRVVGRRIEVDAEAPLRILYIRRVDDPNEYDALFIEAMAARLAAEMSQQLTDNNGLGERMEQVYRDLLSEARMVDAKEGPPRQMPDGLWLDARRGDFA